VIAYEIKKTIDGKLREVKLDASGKILKGKKENKEEKDEDEADEENEADEKD